MDVLLASLQLGSEGVFNLARNLPSVAIKDQMIRAAMVASAMPIWLDGKYQDWRHQPVLVVGAGACGMTLAVCLARQGIEVCVVETSDAPFRLQRHCESRWLDPVLYDWPMDHCWEERFPWYASARGGREVIPFPCPAAVPARDLVEKHWDRDWDIYQLSPLGKLIHVWLGWELVGYPGPDPQGRGVEVMIRDRKSGEGYRDRFAAVVLAFGFREEVTTIEGSSFIGFRFWESDPLEDPTYGGRLQAKEDLVVISGSGDGGLQDFLRVLTRRPSARQIYEDLGLRRKGLRLDVLNSVEARAERAGAWSNHRRSAYPFKHGPYLEERHWAIRREVDRLLDDDRFREAVAAYTEEAPAVTYLISESDHFHCRYGLNLFLALLLARAIKRTPGRSGSLRVLRSRIEDIRSRSPSSLPARPTAADCLGHDWDVHLEGIREPIRANVIVLRHGLDDRARGTPADDPARARPHPMPPTHLPRLDGPAGDVDRTSIAPLGAKSSNAKL